MRMVIVAMLLVGILYPLKSVATDQPLVAVFSIEAKRIKLDQVLLDGLTDYLSSRLVETGKFKVVPRGQLKQRLLGEKNQSFKNCYDQACQIEIGRELAAQQTLSTQILKVGSKCTLTATLFDLREAAAGKAATARGKCDEDDLSKAIDKLASQLAGVNQKKKPLEPKFSRKHIVNGSGLCLDVHDLDMKKNGGRVQLWECIPNAVNQLWSLDRGWLINGGGLRLDAHDVEMKKNGGRVQVWVGSSGINQKWRFDKKSLKNGGGFCLDAHQLDMKKNGCKVQMWECNNQSNQSWAVK